MDAIKIGARIYHGSCYAELKKDGGNTPLRTSRTATPESVLGKRKAVGVNIIFFDGSGLTSCLLTLHSSTILIR